MAVNRLYRPASCAREKKGCDSETPIAKVQQRYSERL